jgi:hydrophobic/amphiphilic exporter-1 (mainly G- bacteria), HAE1 family
LRLSEICVQRPVFAFMLIMFLVVLGLFSFFDLGVDLFPRSDAASVYVRVRLPGATPEEVTSQVIMPLEEAIAAVSGISEMQAMVSEGSGNLHVTFVLERDISEAVEDVREKAMGAMRSPAWPPNALAPIIMKMDPDMMPIMNLVIAGTRSTRELTEIADKQIRRALESIDGVAGVEINGGQLRQVNIYLDIDKLSAYNLTAQDVERAVRSENIEAPGGRIIRGATEVGVRTLGRIENVEQFNDIIVKNVGGAPVRLRDLGTVEDGVAEKRTFAFFKGGPAVTMEIRRQIGTNTVEVVQNVRDRLKEIEREIPAGVQVQVIRDQSIYIKNSVKALEEHLVLGSLLASMIVWMFIRNWRTVLISSIAIPTSIIATFTLIRVMDFTLNSMTLLGLTLAVGIVIDDAIIVLENIYRYIDEKGVEPMEAAIRATREISLAVFATTISLVIIFVPIAFMTGYAKRFVNQFGWTMAMAILVSMLVAFTLTPTLSARMLKKSNKPAHGHEHGFFDRIYVWMLNWSLDHRWAIAAVWVMVFSSTFVINQYIGRDWMPNDDQNELQLFMEMPEGSSVDATEKVARQVAARVEKIPGVTTVAPSSMGGGGRGSGTMASLLILLKDPSERGDINQMAGRIRQELREFAFARPRISFPNALGGRESFAPIRGMLLGPDIRKLGELGKEIQMELMKSEALADVRANLNFSNPEMQVNIDRSRASDLGVRVSDVAGAVRLLMSGEDQISTFKEGSEQYPVTIRLPPGQRDDPAVLSRLLVPSSRLGLIRLDSVASLERGFGPSRIDRYNRQFSVSIVGNVGQGHSLQEAADATTAAISKIGLPTGYQLRFSGQVKILEETTTNMILAISLASIFMYMVLAAQFESLSLPFIIMLTLPLSIPFALLSLIATGRTLNLFSALGILLLLGIVKKNGILQIDLMNTLRQQGYGLREAIVEANRVRLRPILMTTFAIVAGLIPTAVGIGAGAAQRSAIAVTIIGGQTLCLVLTLLVVPVAYSYMEGARAWFGRKSVASASPAMGD